MAVYGYVRTSTAKEKATEQVEKLIAAGVAKENIIIEKYRSGLSKQPALEKLLQKLTTGDTLTVTALDRLVRNTRNALRLIEDFHSKGIILNILNMCVLDDSNNGQMWFKMFDTFASFEKDIIKSRTQEGKAWAKEHSSTFKDGRPKKYTQAQLQWAYSLRQEKGLTYAQVSAETGIGKSTLYEAFKKIREE